MFEFPSDQYRFSSNRMSSVTSYHTEYTPLSDMTGGASTSDTRRFDRGVPLLRQDTLDAVKNVYGNSGQGGDYVKLAAKLVHDAMESRYALLIYPLTTMPCLTCTVHKAAERGRA